MSIKVTYFDIPGRGEPIRLILAYAGVKFENDKVDFPRWQVLKPTLTFGQLPVYEENGRVMNQSTAILRYLGKKYKLHGNNDWEDLEIDSIADTIVDFQLKVFNCHYISSKSRKEKQMELLHKETIPFYLQKFEKIAKENNGHLAINKLTWADFLFASMIDYVAWVSGKDILEPYPNLQNVRNNVLELPAIKKWYRENPINMEMSKQVIAFTGRCTED